VRDAELGLAKQLISQISTDTFDPTKYDDEVKKRIESAIERKLEGQEIAVSPSAPETGGQVIDLMEALKASLAKTTAKRGKVPAAADEAAASSKPAARKAAKKVAEEPAPRRKVSKRA
jgi:DNA end-binding protein Ku